MVGRGATFTVANTNDDFVGSFRQAIIAANSSPGPDQIAFDIPGSGPRLIKLQSPLPALTQEVAIDGYTQAGASRNTLALGYNGVLPIVLDGSNAGQTADGLRVVGAPCTVRGLVIQHFSLSGILVMDGGKCVAEGNLIGTDVTGQVGRGNLGSGIDIRNSAGSRIGGTNPGDRNVISGNGLVGVRLDGPNASSNIVAGNYIGLAANGISPLGNGFEGVFIADSSDNLIGGLEPGAGNVVSANLGAGVQIFGAQAARNRIEGNFIGTDATGLGGLEREFFALFSGNGAGGVVLDFGPHHNLILSNLISGNLGTGVLLGAGSETSDNRIEANRIGTDITGSDPLSNAGTGVALFAGARNSVGSQNAGAGNIIAFNTGAGVAVLIGNSHPILGNRIFSNALIGIDLDAEGATPNDPDDSDEGGNNRQNFPVLGAVNVTSNGVFVSGTLDSTSNTSFRLEFFANPSADPSGFGEGERFLGATNVMTDSSGRISFLFSAAADLSLGQLVTATATDEQNNTSEFSPAVEALGPGPTILVQPVDSNAPLGAAASFSVEAAGAGRLRYQWRRNGVNILGATNAVLTIPAVQLEDNGAYAVVVANEAGAVTSESAGLAGLIALIPRDDFADAQVLSGDVGLYPSSTGFATREPGEPNHGGKAGGASVWFRWRPSTDGIATFRTAGSDFDTLLGVYTGTNVATLTAIASDDDSARFFNSEAQFNARSGTVYHVAVDGLAGQQGSLLLTWELEPTPDVIPVILNPPVSQVVTQGAEASFLVIAAGDNLRYQWLFQGAEILDAVLPSLVLSNVQPAQVGLYAVRVSNPQRFVMSPPVQLEIGLQSRAPSQDKFEDLQSASGAAPLSPPPSLSKRLSTALAPLPGFVSVAAGIPDGRILNNNGATTQQEETNHCGVIGGASRWLRLRPAVDGVLLVDTLDSEIDTVLAAYTNASLRALLLVECDNNSAPDGLRSIMKFAAQASKDYSVAVDSVDATTGIVHLNWALGTPPALASAPPPTNLVLRRGERLELRAVATSAQPLPSYQWSLNGTNLPGATGGTLVVAGVQASNAGIYTVVLSNFAGTLVLTSAVLTVDVPLSLENLSFDPGGEFRCQVLGNPGQVFVVQASSELTNWVALLTNQIGAQPYWFADPQATNTARRFYRARSWP